jgi:membrane-associated phospholipid phosphatase
MKSKPKTNFSRAIGSFNKTRSTICLLSLGLFICLVAFVEEKKPFAIDSFILDRSHQIINPIFTAICKLFYFVGDEYLAAGIVLLNLVILYWRGRRQEANVLGFSTLGILILIDRLIKPIVARRRPLQRLLEGITGYSFPSGHAAGNFILYFYLAYILVERFPHLAKYIYSGTTIFLLLMSFSVVYLRVHWFTDIVGSYAIGYIWLTISLTVLKFTRKKQFVFDGK